MTRRRALITVFTVAGAALVTACGTQGVDLGSKQQTLRAQNAGAAAQVKHGATLFQQRCSGCHTLAAAGTHGSATSIKYRLRTNGPNFNNRKEQYEQVLYAIRNGGFSGAIMPQNLAVGADAVDPREVPLALRRGEREVAAGSLRPAAAGF